LRKKPKKILTSNALLVFRVDALNARFSLARGFGKKINECKV
jgi:hypothetical protein